MTGLFSSSIQMLFILSIVLLAAFPLAAVAHHGKHIRREGHMRFHADLDSTTTVPVVSY